MNLWWVWALAGLAGTAVALPLLARNLQRSRNEGSTTTSLTATGLEQLDGFFNPGKVRELEQRRHEAMLYQDQHDGAPPGTHVDLESGTAVVRLPPEQDAPAQGPSS